MIINSIGTTRRVEVYGDKVRKICYENFKYANEQEYNNYKKYKNIEPKIVNNIISFENNIIEAEKCITLKEFFISIGIQIKSISNCYMDDLFLHIYSEIGDLLNYREKRRILLDSELDFDEFQYPDNWGITKEGELVLLDYSR